MTPMRSVCPGCAHEHACGHAEVHACANREPATESLAAMEAGTAMADGFREGWRQGELVVPRWCSCEPLRRAEAERDRYRAKALRLVCSRQEYFGGFGGKCERCAVRLSGGDESYGYCNDVLKEVDGA